MLVYKRKFSWGITVLLSLIVRFCDHYDSDYASDVDCDIAYAYAQDDYSYLAGLAGFGVVPRAWWSCGLVV